MNNLFQRFLGKSETEKGSNVSSFFSASYQQHNIARLAHLESLKLPIDRKSVFEFGAGVGDHSFYFLIKNCRVTASDSRQELLEIIQKRLGIETTKVDIEKDIEKIRSLPFYDILYCYGVLYHVSNPEEFILALKGKCNLLLLETCVSHDFREQGPHLIEEDVNNPTQASSGLGCRPTRNWILDKMKEVFPYVYLPLTQPQHNEFPKNWESPMEDRVNLVRSVFIGSTSPLNNPLLTEVLVKNYK